MFSIVLVSILCFTNAKQTKHQISWF